MNFFRKLFGPTTQTNQPASLPVRLQLEALEERVVMSAARVVPLAQAVDGVATFHRLQDALKVATNSGDVITIDPGSTGDLGPLTVNNSGITITGNPNVPGSILPSYDLVVNASNVTLTRLNLGSVTINPDFTGDAVTRSTVNTINVNGGLSGLSNALIDQDMIEGFVSVIGLVNTPIANVKVTNNTFGSLITSTTSPLINVQDASNAIIQNNNLTGGGPAPQIGIQVTRGLNNLVANNTIHLSGIDTNTDGILLQNPGFTTATGVIVRNNTIATGLGRGLYVNAFNDLSMQALVQGNDFHNNAIGVEYLGSNTGYVSSDLGGGFNNQGSSLGGNDFRGFPKQGSATNAAIVLRNVVAGASLPARLNIFDDPNNAASAVVTATGSGSIDVNQSLDVNRAFVQTLYNNMLGRTGTIAEINTWMTTLTANASGQTNVLNSILRSDEAYARIVDQYYLQYLGRAADPVGESYWVNQIKGGMTLEQVQAGFVASPEFIGNNNSDYIQGLFRTMLGRTGSPTELAYWYGKLPTLGLSGVALAFSKSQETRNDMIGTIFTQFLHRPATAGDMAYWAAQAGDLLTIEVKLLASGEYFQRG